eukprot:jgi/Mesvir1/20924/Mv07995-RA.1
MAFRGVHAAKHAGNRNRARHEIPDDVLARVDKKVLARLKENFSLFDSDDSGLIDATELGTLLRSAGMNPTEARVRELIRQFDKDRSGSLSFAEYVVLWDYMQEEAAGELEMIMKAFSVFDKDGSRTISFKEFKEVVTELGDQLTDEECTLFFKHVDKNNDGELQFDDLFTFLKEDRERVDNEVADEDLEDVISSLPSIEERDDK